jgi:predicted aldo/keto reductase-like oxidoreductase
MKEKNNKINRRYFLKTMWVAGLGSVVAGCKGKEEKEPNAIDPDSKGKTLKPELSQVPMRKLGTTGVEVPCLCLGGNYNLVERQIILRRALESGVHYWDTAHNYAGGNSEIGIGKFLSKNPKTRKKLFIASKASYAKTAADVEKLLQLSLKRMKTNYIDLYYGVHMLSDPAQLTDELKQWAESAKKRNLIRFLAFSTHENMAKCLAAAAKLDWIDAIMTVYNFRLMQDTEMQAAIEACHKAGIALIAMKTQAAGPDANWAGHAVKVETKEDKKFVGHFQKQGFTAGQAKIKVVLEDERFSSVCVGMEAVILLSSNVTAVRDKTKLTNVDKKVFEEYATATCSSYCAGCANICNSALPNVPCVSNIMRYLMYYNSYGKQDRARQLFAKIPARVRNKLLRTDYRLAEARCPQHLPIAKLVAGAVSKLA